MPPSTTQSSTKPFESIEEYPVPWAHVLPSLLGHISFRVEHPPDRNPPRSWLGVVSSHNSQFGFTSSDWQASLLSALHLAQQQGWGILCPTAAPYSESILHACRRLRVPWLEMEIEDRSGRPKSHHGPSEQRTPSCFQGRIVLGKDPQDVSPIPLHDRAAVFLADHLFALNVRTGGKIAQLIETRLEKDEFQDGSTYISLSSRKPRTSTDSSQDWLQRGAIGWIAIDRASGRESDRPEDRPEDDSILEATIPSTLQPILPLRCLIGSQRKFLIHCTRARRGPWPDQSLAQFHDELLHSPWLQYPDVIASLKRILLQQRLIATRYCRRGDMETVCFSEVPIDQLLKRRRFQSHLSRWDWEPYGIMIDQEWLMEMGVKQVSYVDRAQAKKMSDGQLTYSQIVSNRTTSQDWTAEKEWRLAGDLRLTHVPFSKAYVFVPSMAEAVAIQHLSRWPIAVCDTKT